MSGKSRFYLLLVCILSFGATPAYAQFAVDSTEPSANPAPAQPVRRQYANQPAQNLPDIGRPYSVRVTTGARVNAGFEQALTRHDTNLRHWTWIPVTSYNQAVINVGGGHPQQPARPAHVYVKPNHVPTQIAARPGVEPTMAPRSNYVRPTHVPLPVVDHGTAFIPPVSRWATSDLSGKVKVPHAPAAERAVTESSRPTTAKTYGGGYGDVSGRVKPSYATGRDDSLAVHGRLMRSH
jgi:hypothetical protein